MCKQQVQPQLSPEQQSLSYSFSSESLQSFKSDSLLIEQHECVEAAPCNAMLTPLTNAVALSEVEKIIKVSMSAIPFTVANIIFYKV
jgi:hypothetical protein